MKRYLLLIDEKWATATLSDKDVSLIQDDLKGISFSEHTITLENGEPIETGIIDNIKPYPEVC